MPCAAQRRVRLPIHHLTSQGPLVRIVLTSFVLLSALAGCASIKHTSNAQQPVGQTVLAGVGDVVLRVDRQRDLENFFGKATISGRKTNEGYSELRFAGVERTGEVVLYRKDMRIITNETTMSRSPLSTIFGSSTTSMSGAYTNYGGTGTINANAQTNYSSTIIAPTNDFHVVVPAETIPVRLAPGETRFPMEGYIIEIVKVTPNSLEYRVTKQ